MRCAVCVGLAVVLVSGGAQAEEATSGGRSDAGATGTGVVAAGGGGVGSGGGPVGGAGASPGGAAGGVAGVLAQQQLAVGLLYLSSLGVLSGVGARPDTPEERDQLERMVTEYFTNGAAATAVPSEGPGAEYFHNGAAVLAAPTATATPTGPPEVGDGGAAQGPGAPEAGAVIHEAGAPTAPSAQPPAQTSPPPTATTPAPPQGLLLPPTSGAKESSTQSAAQPGESAAVAGARLASNNASAVTLGKPAPTGAQASTHAPRSVRPHGMREAWLAALFGTTALGVALSFLGARLRRP